LCEALRFVTLHHKCWLILASYFIASFLDYGMFEVYPLWAMSTVGKGGLDWRSATIGETQLIGGLFLLIGNLAILPMMQRRLRPLALYTWGILLFCIPGFVLFPLASLLKEHFLVVLPILFLRIVGPGIVFTLSFQFINNMGPPALRGGISGVSFQVGCLARALGPACWSTLFAWGNRSTLPFPLDSRITFLLFGLVWLVPIGLVRQLQEEDVTEMSKGDTSTEMSKFDTLAEADAISAQRTVEV